MHKSSLAVESIVISSQACPPRLLEVRAMRSEVPQEPRSLRGSETLVSDRSGGQSDEEVRAKLDSLRPFAGRHLNRLDALDRSEMRSEEKGRSEEGKGFDWRGMVKALREKLANWGKLAKTTPDSEPQASRPTTHDGFIPQDSKLMTQDGVPSDSRLPASSLAGLTTREGLGAVALQELTASREQTGGALYEAAEKLIELAMTEELSRRMVENHVEDFRKATDAEIARLAGQYSVTEQDMKILGQQRDRMTKKLEMDLLEARKLKKEADQEKADEARLLADLEAEERERLAREASDRAKAEQDKADAERIENEKRIAEADQALRKMLRKIRQELPPAIAGIQQEEALDNHTLVIGFRTALESSPLGQERRKQLAQELDIILKPLAGQIRSRLPKAKPSALEPVKKKPGPAKAPDSEDPEVQWAVAKLGDANRAVQRHLYQDALEIYREIIRHDGILSDKRAKALLGAAHAIEMLTKGMRQRDQRQAYDVEGFGYCQQLVEMQGVQKDLKSHGFLSGSRFLSDERLYQEAVDFLEEGLKKDPANVNLLTQKAWVFFYWGKSDRNSEKLSAACRIADDVLRQTPGLLPAYKAKFAAMEARGDSIADLEKVLEEAEPFDAGQDKRNSLAGYRERLENLKRRRSELRAEDRGMAGQREAEKAASLKNVVQTVIDELHELSNDDLEGKKFYYLEILRDALTSSRNPEAIFTMIAQIWRTYPKSGHPYMEPSRVALKAAMAMAKEAMPETSRKKWDQFSLRKSKTDGERSEIRIAAASFLRELTARGVPVNELEESARVTVRVGVQPVIDELLGMKDAVDRRWQAAIERVIEQLCRTSSGDHGVYAVAYSLDATAGPMEISDFVDTVISLGVIKQIILPSGQKFQDELTKRLKSAGVMISQPGARQKTVFVGDQEVAGVVMAQKEQIAPVSFSAGFVPVVSVGQSQTKDPQLARLVITLQTAIALLLAREAKKGEKLLKPELIRRINELFPGLGSSVIQVQGDGLIISSDTIYQMLMKSVFAERLTASAA